MLVKVFQSPQSIHGPLTREQSLIQRLDVVVCKEFPYENYIGTVIETGIYGNPNEARVKFELQTGPILTDPKDLTRLVNITALRPLTYFELQE